MKKTPEEFRNWIEKKIEIEFSEEQENSIEVGQFWRYYDWMNIGNEISKDNLFKRVCLVLNNNLWNGLVLVAPMTSKNHSRLQKFYVPISESEKYNIKTSNAIINQIKLLDKKRFVWKMTEKKASLELVQVVLRKYRKLIYG